MRLHVLRAGSAAGPRVGWVFVGGDRDAHVYLEPDGAPAIPEGLSVTVGETLAIEVGAPAPRAPRALPEPGPAVAPRVAPPVREVPTPDEVAEYLMELAERHAGDESYQRAIDAFDWDMWVAGREADRWSNARGDRLERWRTSVATTIYKSARGGGLVPCVS